MDLGSESMKYMVLLSDVQASPLDKSTTSTRFLRDPSVSSVYNAASSRRKSAGSFDVLIAMVPILQQGFKQKMVAIATVTTRFKFYMDICHSSSFLSYSNKFYMDICHSSSFTSCNDAKVAGALQAL